MFAFACILAVIFQCTPIPKAWEKIGTVPGHCININASLFAHAVLNIFQDAVTYVLPMRMLYALQIPRRQKIALVLIFALGGFVTITGIVRIGSLKSALRTPDPFYDNAGAVMWSSVECNVGVVCASLPHFKPFLDRYLPSLMRGRSREPSKTAPVLKGPIMKSVGTSTKQGYERQPESPDLELGHRDTCGTGDSYEGGYNYSINAGGNPRFGVSSSEEHLRDLEAQDSKRGIYKSTTVSVGTKS
ncbi:hypothetical protein MMC30_002509 [Trapelia coarctata]|nr:hypothetical protein [Trapelia coarctata]